MQGDNELNDIEAARSQFFDVGVKLAEVHQLRIRPLGLEVIGWLEKGKWARQGGLEWDRPAFTVGEIPHPDVVALPPVAVCCVVGEHTAGQGPRFLGELVHR